MPSSCRRKRLLVLLALLIGAGCGKPAVVFEEIAGGQRCKAGEECAVGFVCVDGLCRAICNTTGDCQNENEICVKGVCDPIGTPSCMSDADCVEPPPCRVAAGATCASGTCVYPLAAVGSVCDDGTVCTVAGTERCDLMGRCVGDQVICNTPPFNVCLQENTVYREYEDVGTCDPVNGCEYEAIETDCAPDCLNQCLRPCEGFVCDEYNGGCRDDGFCVATVAGPVCEYLDVADDGELCFRDVDTDEAHGVCLAGECVDCLTRDDCLDAPGVLACYDTTCSALSECEYLLQEDRECMPLGCADGYLSNARICGPAGDCPSTGGTSCDPYGCTPNGLACLGSCAGDGDCAAGFFCTGASACAAQLADGVACAGGLGGRDCLSGHCQNGFCCAGGNCCAAHADCDPFDGTGTCNDAANCQGRRQDSSCVAFQCVTGPVDDDSACAGYVGAACGTFADYLCTDATAQLPPTCLTSCLTSGVADDAKCDAGLVCQQATGTCQAPAGLGDCCLHAACGMAPCQGALQCGNSQSPPAYVCCSAGARCCASDGDCVGGYRCNTVLAECHTSCATEDDSRCLAAHHCETAACAVDKADGASCTEHSDCQSNFCRNGICCAAGLNCCSTNAPCGVYACDTTTTHACFTACLGENDSRCDAMAHCDSSVCVADLGDGSLCNEDSDCITGNCAEDFDSTAGYCAPEDTCARTSTSYAIGYELCSGSTFYRSCASEGVWGLQQNSPDSANDYCDAGAGYGTGYDLAAVCTSGASGGFADSGCVSCSPYVAASPSSCFSNCATNDDGKCWAAFHCNTLNQCVADLANGQPCAENSDCSSGNCSADFGTAQGYCAPPNTCADGASSYTVGYALCSAASYYRACQAQGVWGPIQNSPQATPLFCDAGGGAQSGYDPAAVCTSGPSGGFTDLGCTSCAPYKAQTTTSCFATCATNDDNKCWATSHCSGSNVCVADFNNGTACLEDSDCGSGNCSDDFDSATLYCAPSNTCADNAAAYDVGYELCSGNTYFKTCTAEGSWGSTQSNPQAGSAFCDAGGGPQSGYDPAAVCSSGLSGGFTNQGCVSCSPYNAATTSSCHVNCATEDDAKCWSTMHCEGSACVGDLANGQSCANDLDCLSNNCAQDFDSASLFCAPAGMCADNANFYEIGYEHCNGNSYYKSCTGEGVWGLQQNNPDPANDFCDAGGGAQSGYDLAATCSDGSNGGFTNPGCVNCGPYNAATTASCNVNCAVNDDSKCWTTHHCDASNLCALDLTNGAICFEGTDCVSGNCSTDFNSSNRYCAPVNTCADGAATHAVGYELCSGHAFYKSCTGSGTWGAQQDNPQPTAAYCDAGGGTQSGYDPPASCASGTSGGFANPACVSCTPYKAATTASCYVNCNTNDDGKCWTTHHCDNTNACVVDLGNGAVCLEASDCGTGNCSDDFDSATRYCAPGGTCANNASTYLVGYELCSGNSYYKSCAAEGTWGPQQDSPQTAAVYCDAGGGAQSGYDPAAVCASGSVGGFGNAGCTSCSPYVASSTSGCYASCATNNDTRCWAAYHCGSGDICLADLSSGAVCLEDSDCTSGNCSDDFDSATDYCASTGACADNGASYVIGYELCSGNSYYKSCIGEGTWSSATNSPDSANDYCNAGGGASSGYDLAATCASGATGGFTDPPCTSCNPYLAATTSSCRTSCTDSAQCWGGVTCAPPVCQGLLANGAVCTADGDCQSNNCSQDFDSSTLYCAPVSTCADNANSYAVGYELCSGHAWVKSCTAEGVWSAQQNNPQPSAAFCNAGGGASSGYDPPATCASGLSGGFNDPTCVSCSPYQAMNTAACYTSCATNDDAKCWSAFHCDGSNVCAADLSNGSACGEDSDCTSANCSQDFATGGSYCAAAGQCASGASGYAVGYELCSGSAWYKSCTAEGVWGAQQNSPQPSAGYCDAGGGAGSGYDPAASCTSGTSGGFTDPPCVSCTPYMASSTSACHTSCATNDDGKCWSTHHCSGTNTCVADFGNGTVCLEDSDCGSSNCATDFDSSTLYCAPVSTCANNASSYAVGYELCSGSSYFKSCASEGTWGSQQNSPQTTAAYCDAGGGAGSGYDPAATCTSGSAGGFTDPGCTSCSPYMASSTTACYASCTGDSNCWSAYHCASNACVADGGNGSACVNDTDCVSGNCSADFDSSGYYCAPAGTCADNANNYGVGYELCSGQSYYKSCNSEGVWGTQQNSPQATAAYCDAGGGANSGYDPAAICSSGTTGGFTNPGCTSCSPYLANSTSSCYTSCATNDDGKCWTAFHCDGSNVCSGDLANGSVCLEDSDCATNNCSADFDSSTLYCAPASTCADNGASYAIGYELCSGNSYYKSCTAEGTWGTQQSSPQTSYAYCDAGGGAQSGYDPPATCNSGTSGGFTNPTCVSCSPYLANSTSSCYTSCATNDDGKCWAAAHCSGSNTCVADFSDGTGCLEDSDCSSSNCSADFDSSSFYCAPASTCANNASSYSIGYELCSGHSYYKSCTSEGVWGSQVNSPQTTSVYCNPGGGTSSGYDPAATCTSGSSGGFTNPGCTSCAPYMASSTTSCYTSCATNDDGKCWAAYHCSGSNTCLGDFVNSTVCLEDSDCASNNCSQDLDSSTLYCTPASQCANNSTYYNVNWGQCVGHAYYKVCTAEGTWGTTVNSPDPTDDYCVGCCSTTGTGYDLAATCNSGTSPSFTNPGCVSCSPYRAASPSSCYTNCATNDTAKCVPYYVCWQGGSNTCIYQDSRCDDEADCPDPYTWCNASYCEKSSCPFIYVWNGGSWQYVTDEEVNVIGLQPKHRPQREVKDYKRNYVVIDGLARDGDGLFRVKLRETLYEVDYVDMMKLVAVDYPIGASIASSDAESRHGDPSRPFRVWTYREPRPPLRVTDWRGRDALAAALELDGVPIAADRKDPDFVTVDFGKISDLEHARLVIDGWAMFGKEFHTDTIVQTHLEVVDAQGAWVKAKRIGLPAGDLKTMVVDIHDVFVSTDHRLRIHLGTNQRGRLRWVIDRIRLDTTPSERVTLRELDPVYVSLGYKGRAGYVPASFTHRISSNDDSLGAIDRALGFGDFTRFGEVTELLTVEDDKFVIMQHGDELVAAFPDAGPPAAGMQRGYMLLTKLYYKQPMLSREVEPLPFSGMTAYPYPDSERYPDGPEHRAYRATWNTRRYDPATIAKVSLQPPLAAARLRLFATTNASRHAGLRDLAAVDRRLAQVLTRETSAELVGDAPRPGERACVDQACRVRAAAESGATHAVAVVVTGVGARCALTAIVDDVATGSTAAAASVDVVCRPDALERGVADLVRALGRPMINVRR